MGKPKNIVKIKEDARVKKTNTIVKSAAIVPHAFLKMHMKKK